MKIIGLGLLFLSSIFSQQVFSAQANLTIKKTDQDIKVDGELNEMFWEQATKVELGFETRPGENTVASVKTTAYIIENGSSLFIGIIAEDPDTSQIQASLKDRDRVWSDDLAGFKIDTFNDERKAYNFFVNPLGIQMDSIEDDVIGNEDSSWDAIWYSEGKITEKGYQVEIEIPFKVLRFPDKAGEKTWGIDFVRMYPRSYQYRFAHNKVERDKSCFVCQIGKISGFENIQSGKNLEVVPYVSAQRADNRNPPEQVEWQNGDLDLDGGVDVRWGVTDNSVLSATVNPDFSQIESNAIQLDVNRTFALFFQEKRPFFLEGADYFRTPFNLLHTRNIADPDYAIKYTGKTGKHSYGVLTAKDNSTSFLRPGVQSSGLGSFEGLESDAFVARYAYDIGEKSQIGGLITHRSSGEGYENTVASVDGKYYFTDEDVVRYQLVYSDTTDINDRDILDPNTNEVIGSELVTEDIGTGDGYHLSYNHNGRNWSWRGSRTEFDDGFRADLGFMNQVGFSKDVIGAGYTWHGEEGDTFNRIHLGGDVDQTHDFTGQKLEDEQEFWVNMNGPYQSHIGFGAGVSNSWYSNASVGLDLPVPASTDDIANCELGCTFDNKHYWFSANMRPVSSLQIGFRYNGGSGVDFSSLKPADRLNYGISGNWQATQHFFIQASLDKSNLDRNAGNVFEADIINLTSTYQFDKQQFLRLTVRYSDVQRNVDSIISARTESKSMGRQLLYSYKVNPRTVFFLGYSDSGFENGNVDDFEKTGRSIFSKFSYAFQL